MALAGSRSDVGGAHIQAFTFSSQDHGRLSDMTSTYPSIHVETLRITVGCLWCTYPSVRNKNLHTCGLWARPPVLTPVPVPSQAIHSRAGLNLHYSDIQSRTPTDTTTERHDKKKGGNFLLQEFFWRGFFLYYSFKLIPKNRRHVKLQALQFHINSKTTGI